MFRSLLGSNSLTVLALLLFLLVRHVLVLLVFSSTAALPKIPLESTLNNHLLPPKTAQNHLKLLRTPLSENRVFSGKIRQESNIQRLFDK